MGWTILIYHSLIINGYSARKARSSNILYYWVKFMWIPLNNTSLILKAERSQMWKGKANNRELENKRERIPLERSWPPWTTKKTNSAYFSSSHSLQHSVTFIVFAQPNLTNQLLTHLNRSSLQVCNQLLLDYSNSSTFGHTHIS